MEAAISFQDEIYTRIADLEEDSRVFGADLYCHKRCMEAYLSKLVGKLTLTLGPVTKINRVL